MGGVATQPELHKGDCRGEYTGGREGGTIAVSAQGFRPQEHVAVTGVVAVLKRARHPIAPARAVDGAKRDPCSGAACANGPLDRLRRPLAPAYGIWLVGCG